MRAALTVLFALASLCSAQTPPSQEDPGTSYLYRVPGPISPALHALLHSEFDVLGSCSSSVGAPPTELRVVVQPGDERRRFLTIVPGAQFLERGRPFHAVLAEMMAAGPEAADPAYFTPAEIEAEMDALVASYPTLARKVDLTTFPGAARTHGNRSIFALKVSDNVTADEDEPAILIAAQHHARELNSPYMVIGAMRRVLQGYATDPTLRAVVDDKELWFVPCVNPDGVQYVFDVDQWWRKNRRNNGGSYGVDLNRNYTSNWGLCGSSSLASSETYRGPSAASEPETRTMQAAVRALRPEIYFDYHSSGREVLFPYPTCSTYSGTISTFVRRYVDDLRNQSAYGTRSPSGSGEAPEDHWIQSGTLSFLTEISTSFQPAFSSTIAEEAIVWPGIRRALTTWAPALRGHVRSIYQGQPVAASVRFTPNQFSEGEQRFARDRDGRYGLWLPLGTWQVIFEAPGFVTETRTVTVSTYDSPQTLDIDLVPAWPTATLTPSGNPRLGVPATLTYQSPGDGGLFGWVALSDGTSPGIALGSRTLPMNGDDLMVASISAAPLLTGNLQNLSAAGDLVATLTMPPLPLLVGVDFYACGITFEPGYVLGVKRWSQPVLLVVQP
ncbi:MAG: hypothetical protein IPM29_32455 [Planctomycetes bacterium]|nr:hypothetical protein [Planctomycetota bacterium]